MLGAVEITILKGTADLSSRVRQTLVHRPGMNLRDLRSARWPVVRGGFWMIRRILACAGLLLAGCANQPTITAGTTGGQAAVGKWGVDLSMIDKSVKPGEDFFA